MKYFFLVLALLLVFIFASLSATIVPIEGKIQDDWRIWWNTKVLGSDIMSNFAFYEPSGEPVYFYNPIEWNEDGISRVSYESCIDTDELIAKYQIFLKDKDKGMWRKTEKQYQELSVVSLDNNEDRLSQRSLDIFRSANQCAKVIYTERTPKDL